MSVSLTRKLGRGSLLIKHVKDTNAYARTGPSHFIRKFPTVLDTPIEGENGTEVSSGVKESENAILSSKA